MKKSLFSTIFTPVLGGFAATLILMATISPVIAAAQPYYGNYSYSAYQTCLALTYYQGPGTTDAQTAGQVSELQTFLNQAGYLSGISGTYDNGTLGAVINFQRAYGITITGTLTPQTLLVINQQSCGAGVGSSVIGNYGSSYPVTNYSNGNNCYWSGTTYNSTYVCSNSVVPAQYVPPTYIAPSPVVCNWNTPGYYNGSYGNNIYGNGSYGNYCNGTSITSISASYSYNTVTLTLTGYGFSPTGNTVYFGNSAVSNAVSPNGTTLTFTVPAGYSWGTYGVHVTTAQGVSSNTLSFTLNNSNWYGWNGNNNGSYNNGYYNNGQNISASLSSISGPSNLVVNQPSTWTISVYNGQSSYNTNYNSNYYNSNLTVNWGDGSQTNNVVANSGGQAYTFTHDYVTPGSYTMRVTLNSNGSSSYQTYIVNVTGYGQYNQYQYNQQYGY